MPERTTEICILPLVAGLDLNSGDTKKLWEDALTTIKSSPGCESLYWGRQVEHPDVVQMMIGGHALFPY